MEFASFIELFICFNWKANWWMNRKLMVTINWSWLSLSGLAQTHVRGCQVAVLILLSWKKNKKHCSAQRHLCEGAKPRTFNPCRLMSWWEHQVELMCVLQVEKWTHCALFPTLMKWFSRTVVFQGVGGSWQEATAELQCAQAAVLLSQSLPLHWQRVCPRRSSFLWPSPDSWQ